MMLAMDIESRPCSICRRLHKRPQRYCLKCHATYMRAWRMSHPLTAEQRFKDNARSYAGVYKRRGKLIERPCRKCGGKAQMHHPDYSRPLLVEWLCRKHHLELHQHDGEKVQNPERNVSLKQTVQHPDI